MKTILVPLDGSLTAEEVLPYVRLLAPLLNAKVHLLRVFAENDYEAMLADTLIGHDLPPGYQARQHDAAHMDRHAAEHYLLAQTYLLRSTGLDVSMDVCGGPPAEMIVEVAAREHAAMIVMATHCHTGARRWALGSIADKVLHAAPVPLLLVRPDAETTE